MTYLVPLNSPSELALPSDFHLESGATAPIDIETGFDDDDFISIALPDFPLGDIDIDNSYVKFTSNPDGNFGAGPTASVAFSASLETLVEGDSEFRFKRELLNDIDLSTIYGVRFEINATSDCTFRCLAIRCLSKGWVYAPVDMETRYNRLVRTVSLNGEVDPTPDPMFASWPTMIRSGTPPSVSDPTPIDASLAVTFNPGSKDDDNRISIFLREVNSDYTSMLELDGTPMEDLDGLPQPDFSDAQYSARVMIDLDGVDDNQVGIPINPGAITGLGVTMADLNGTQMFDLERKPDLLSAAYIELRLDWNATDSTLGFYDSEGVSPFYEFDLTLIPNTDYTLFVDLRENTCRARLYDLDGNQVDNLIFDTTEINDSSIFKRRKGRIGWSASLGDGDAYLSHIRPRYLNYAEYRSQEFESLTPVFGAQLYASATEDSDLFKGINPGPWGGSIQDYPERSPEAFRIRNTGTLPLQGIQTAPVYFDDFAHTSIEFELLMAAAAIESFYVFLWDGFNPIDLSYNLPKADTWSKVHINLNKLKDTVLPGYYTLVMIQSVTGLANDWVVDNISIRRDNIAWDGRGFSQDAWGVHENDWVPFNDMVNDPHHGIVFRERANSLQVRAQALRQDSTIDQIQIVPKYAELGRIVWEEEGHIPSATSAPVAQFTHATSARTVTFTSTAYDTSGYIASNWWTFGDGDTDFGSVVVHTFKSAGTYPVTLTVTDNNGERVSTATDITVT